MPTSPTGCSDLRPIPALIAAAIGAISILAIAMVAASDVTSDNPGASIKNALGN